MLLAYTKTEGGGWYSLEVGLPEDAVVEQLKLFHHECDVNFRGDPHRTCVDNVHVCAVRFPDGRIWDSLLCDIDTPENVATYLAKERLVCHF